MGRWVRAEVKEQEVVTGLSPSLFRKSVTLTCAHLLQKLSFHVHWVRSLASRQANSFSPQPSARGTRCGQVTPSGPEPRARAHLHLPALPAGAQVLALVTLPSSGA